MKVIYRIKPIQDKIGKICQTIAILFAKPWLLVTSELMKFPYETEHTHNGF